MILSRETKERLDYALKLTNGIMPIGVIVAPEEKAESIVYISGRKNCKAVEILTQEESDSLAARRYREIEKNDAIIRINAEKDDMPARRTTKRT